MRKYKNETSKCPFCNSDSIFDNCSNSVVFENNAQITWECDDCQSTWDIVYEAFAIVNEYKGGNNE